MQMQIPEVGPACAAIFAVDSALNISQKSVAMEAKPRSKTCVSVKVACAAAVLACLGIPELRWKAALFLYLPFRDMEFTQPVLDHYLDLEMWWSL